MSDDLRQQNQAALLPSICDGLYPALGGICLELAAILLSDFNVKYQSSFRKKHKDQGMALKQCSGTASKLEIYVSL